MGPTRASTRRAARFRSPGLPVPITSRRSILRSRAPAWSGFHDSDDYRRRYPDGRIGSLPSLSTPDAGRRLVDASVKDLAGKLNRFLDEP